LNKNQKLKFFTKIPRDQNKAQVHTLLTSSGFIRLDRSDELRWVCGERLRDELLLRRFGDISSLAIEPSESSAPADDSEPGKDEDFFIDEDILLPPLTALSLIGS
jgi:hypothetical protein